MLDVFTHSTETSLLQPTPSDPGHFQSISPSVQHIPENGPLLAPTTPVYEFSSPATQNPTALQSPSEPTPAYNATQRDEGSYSCIRCKKEFRTLLLKNKHARRHDQHIRCSYLNCAKAFRDRTDLQRHVKNVHDVTVQEFACPIEGCSRTFKGRKDNMYKHVRQKHAAHVQLIG